MRSPGFAEIIAHTSSFSVLLPIILYLVKLRKADRPVHIIGTLLILSAMCDGIGYFLFKAQKSTAVVFNIYYTLMFFLLCWFYYEIFFKDRHKRSIYIGVAVYVTSFILITFFVQHFFFYQNLIWMIAGIILVVYSIAYFLYSLAAIPSVRLFENTLTWINSGILFYFSLSLFIFSLSDYLFNEHDTQVSLLIWSTHNVNNIMKNVLFAIGLGLYDRRRISISEI